MRRWALLALFVSCSALAQAPAVIAWNEAFLNWTPVTQFTDQTPIPLGAASYRVETLSGTSWLVVITVNNTSTLIAGLPPGQHSWRVVTIVNSKPSAASDVVTKVIGKTPKATTPITVQ